MKFIFCILFSLVVFLSPAAKSLAEDWKELSADHFVVYYTGDEKFAKEVSEKAEVYYQRIATDLGYPRYSEFWTWDKRVKIYIFPDRHSFINSTNQPNWSEGMADYKGKKIISYAWNRGFVESLLPHEMAHLIFRDFVGFRGEIPLWLDEGVAQWEEEAKRSQIKQVAKKRYDDSSIISLSDMMNLDIRKVTEDDKVYIRSTRMKDGQTGVLFLSGNNLVTTYYIQSVSLVGFLIERFGSYSFADFCRQLRDGKGLEEALRFAYPTYIRSLDELETKWREYLDKGQ